MNQPKTLLLNRIAVSTFFFINGFLFANSTSRMPDLQSTYRVNDAELGTILFCVALGSMCAMPFAGWLASKFGSKRMVVISALLFCFFIPFIPKFQDVWLIRGIFFIIGATLGSMDVTMNGQAVLVERQWGKVIFSSFHAVFSIGMTLGAISGSFFSEHKVNLTEHLTIMSFISVVILVIASFFLIRDTSQNSKSNKEIIETPHNYWHTMKIVLPFALIAFCCMTGEGAMADWSALYMNKIIGQNESLSAKAFATYALAMTIGRVFGDYFTMKLGRLKLILIESFLCFIGLGLALLFANIWATFVGFFLVGLGVAAIVPIAYSSAGNLKGIAPSLGISIVTSIGYSGFFIAPPLIGYISNISSLRYGLLFVLLLFAIMIGIVQTLKLKEQSKY